MRTQGRRRIPWIILGIVSLGTVHALAGTTLGHEPSYAPLAQSFTLQVGAQVSIDAEELTITFVSVEEDTRCPPLMVCVWAGNARILLQLHKVQQEPGMMQLNTSSRFPRERGYLDYRVTLVGVTSPAGAPKSSDHRGYTVTLVVSKS